MSNSKPNSWRQILLGLAALVVLVGIAGIAVYGLSRVLTGTVGGAVAGGAVGLLSILASKSFEHQKHHEAAIAEKKREVYRRLLTPWERMLVEIRSNKQGDELLANVDFAALYASSFDAVLYGSETVVQRYVNFRSPDTERDPIDFMRALAALLIAMREDVTGKKTKLSDEAVLRTFVNFKPEELVALRLREYVSKNPEAQRRVAEMLAGKTSGSDAGSETKGPG